MKSIVSITFCFLIVGVNAQITYSETLDQNNAAALISDEGMFFSNPLQGTAGYEIPKNSGSHTVYAMSPWVAALDGNGQVRFSGNSYNMSNFHSGPIADPAYYGTTMYNNQYQNALWSVTDVDIQSHILNSGSAGYVVPLSIANWPGNGDVSIGVADQLAPYVDLDNDGVYEPQDGEYPDIRGDKATYVIWNDASFQATGHQLNAEMHIMFYQILDGSYLDDITFMHVEVFNRSTSSYYDYRQTFYIDFDLGNYSDDFVGCDTMSNLGYVYNGDSNDESAGGNVGYGIDPPCQGLTVLSHDMSSFGAYNSSSLYPATDPTTPIEYWNHMNGTYSDGTPWINPITNATTTFAYSGNPSDTSATSWSEQSNGGAGNPPGDRRVAHSISEDEFLAGSSICSEYAWVYDRSGDRLENVNNVINISNSLKSWFDLADGSFLCSGNGSLSVEDHDIVEFTMYPNPSSGNFTIELPQIENQITVDVIDVSGRVILSESHSHTDKIQLSLDDAKGVYVVKTTVGNHSSIQRLICN